MDKLENKLENFSDANKRLREAIIAFKNSKENTLYRDALIQRFEFTFELAWKALANYLKDQGHADIPLSPKPVFKTAYSAGYISDEEKWLKILEDRNFMSHTYKEDLAERIADDICHSYGNLLNNLLKTLSQN